MCYIKEDLVKDFICALTPALAGGARESNRLVAVSVEDQQAKRFTPIEDLP